MMLESEPKNRFDAGEITQAYREHPNQGWIPCTPCEAISSSCLLGWRISIGVPADCGRIKNPVEIMLFKEAVFWESLKKGINKNEIRLYSLAGTVAERLRILVSDELRIETVQEILQRES